MTRWARLAAAILLASFAVAAGPSATSGPETLSAQERADRLSRLGDEDRRWLVELVAPIVLPEEEAVFLGLENPADRARFREAFWARREKNGMPFPFGPGYRGRYESLRLLADTTYDGWRQDAGRMVLRHGEPSSIDTLQACRLTFRELEIWTYSGREFQGTRRFFFYRVAPLTPRKLFSYGTSDSELLSPESCRKTMEELGRDCLPPDPRMRRDRCIVNQCAEACSVWQLYTEIRTMQASRLGGESESARLLDGFPVSTEDLTSFRGTSPALSSTVPAPPAPTPAPKAAAAFSPLQGRVPKLSSREKAARIKDLSDDDRRWLTEYVAPIILPDEENLFLQLPAGYPREMFREEFWKRRERDGMRDPFGPGYRSRYDHLLEIADSDYDGRFGDAGRLVVRRGEPAGIEEFKDCSEVFRQAEIWTYPPDNPSGPEIHFLFYRSSFGAPRKLWFPGDTEIFQTASCLSSFDLACVANGQPQHTFSTQCIGAMSVPKSCRSACYVSRIAEEIRSRGTAVVAGDASFAPKISTESLDGLWQRLATSVDPSARRIDVQGPSGASSAPRPAAAPEPAPEAWTSDVIRDRIIALPKKYRDFLDVAAPIMSGSELVAFLGAKPGDRDVFIRKFWRQHSKKG